MHGYQGSENNYIEATPIRINNNNNPTMTQKGNGFDRGFKFNQVLCDKLMPVRVKCPDREEFTQLLSVKLVLHAQQSSNSQQQVLTLELTDPDQNAYFLYTLDCSESDFHVLRSEQQFLFDFQMFPSYIMQHLESCMASSESVSKRFVCSLQVGISNEAVFSLVEQNQYQTLAHLSLKLKQGNDETVKRHLASKLKESKEAIMNLKRSLDALDDTYAKSVSTNEQIMTEFNQLREENRRIVDQLKIEEQKRLNEMKESSFSVQEKMLLEQAEIQARSESEKRDMAHRHQKDV